MTKGSPCLTCVKDQDGHKCHKSVNGAKRCLVWDPWFRSSWMDIRKAALARQKGNETA